MDIEGEFRDVKLSMSFELDTWADAEKAKITAHAERVREAIGKPAEPTWEQRLWASLRNQGARQQAVCANYGQQYGPYGNPYSDNALGGFFDSLLGNPARCQCCGR
jgi:hypothetical protein